MIGCYGQHIHPFYKYDTKFFQGAYLKNIWADFTGYILQRTL